MPPALNDALLIQDNDNAVWALLDAESPADPNDVDEAGKNALHVAVMMCEDHALFERILDGIVNINAVDNEGNTALIIAAMQGYDSMVNDILKKPHININLQNNTGHTALYYASQQNHQNVVRLLTIRRSASRLMGLKNKLRF
jgi:ankyrin repeat protein